MTDLAIWLEALHANPLDGQHRLVMADWCEEHGELGLSAKALREGRIPLSWQDVNALKALKSCNYAPATWDKKFARQLEPDENGSITPRQYLWLWILLRRYRKSVRDPAIRAEAERRNKPYQAIVEANIVKPKDNKPLPKTDRARAERIAKARREVKFFEMPLFD